MPEEEWNESAATAAVRTIGEVFREMLRETTEQNAEILRQQSRVLESFCKTQQEQSTNMGKVIEALSAQIAASVKTADGVTANLSALRARVDEVDSMVTRDTPDRRSVLQRLTHVENYQTDAIEDLKTNLRGRWQFNGAVAAAIITSMIAFAIAMLNLIGHSASGGSHP